MGVTDGCAKVEALGVNEDTQEMNRGRRQPRTEL